MSGARDAQFTAYSVVRGLKTSKNSTRHTRKHLQHTTGLIYGFRDVCGLCCGRDGPTGGVGGETQTRGIAHLGQDTQRTMQIAEDSHTQNTVCLLCVLL